MDLHEDCNRNGHDSSEDTKRLSDAACYSLNEFREKFYPGKTKFFWAVSDARAAIEKAKELAGNDAAMHVLKCCDSWLSDLCE